jgi:hypothetical protein
MRNWVSRITPFAIAGAMAGSFAVGCSESATPVAVPTGSAVSSGKAPVVNGGPTLPAGHAPPGHGATGAQQGGANPNGAAGGSAAAQHGAMAAKMAHQGGGAPPGAMPSSGPPGGHAAPGGNNAAEMAAQAAAMAAKGAAMAAHGGASPPGRPGGAGGPPNGMPGTGGAKPQLTEQEAQALGMAKMVIQSNPILSMFGQALTTIGRGSKEKRDKEKPSMGMGPSGHGGPPAGMMAGGRPPGGHSGPPGMGGPGGTGPTFPEGSAEAALKKIADKVLEGDFSDLEDVIAENAKGILAAMRSDTMDETKAETLKEQFSNVRLVSSKGSASTRTITLDTQEGHILVFTMVKSDDSFVAKDFVVKQATKKKKR